MQNIKSMKELLVFNISQESKYNIHTSIDVIIAFPENDVIASCENIKSRGFYKLFSGLFFQEFPIIHSNIYESGNKAVGKNFRDNHNNPLEIYKIISFLFPPAATGAST